MTAPSSSRKVRWEGSTEAREAVGKPASRCSFSGLAMLNVLLTAARAVLQCGDGVGASERVLGATLQGGNLLCTTDLAL